MIEEGTLTQQYFEETGNVKHHQIFLLQHLLQELLQSLHGTAHGHPGISKMQQKIRQKYYYPGVAKHVKKRVGGCQQCAKDKRVPKQRLRLNSSICRNETSDQKKLWRLTYCRVFHQVEDMKRC